jgi:hypothetical protein
MTSPSVHQVIANISKERMSVRQGYRQVVRQPYRQHKEKCRKEKYSGEKCLKEKYQSICARCRLLVFDFFLRLK